MSSSDGIRAAVGSAPWELEPTGPGSQAPAIRDAVDARLVILGSAEALLDPATSRRLPDASRALVAGFAGSVPPSDEARTTTTWSGKTSASRVTVAVLPTSTTRHESAARLDQATVVLRSIADEDRAEALRVLVACRTTDDVVAAAIAVTRALPTFSRRASSRAPGSVRVAFVTPDGVPTPSDDRLLALRDAVARTMALQDLPSAELDTDAFVTWAAERATSVGAAMTLLRGPELLAQGLSGIWHVGRAARRPPALVVLRSTTDSGPAPGRTVAWVGKGITFDSGGLSLKRPAEMRGMKGDMTGAAVVLEAFCAAVELGVEARLLAVLCVAENAVGPDALHPDDIVTMHSGRTVEVVDTDCEGRLVLADGCSWVTAHHAVDELVTVATLTDAALVATGPRHAAIVANDEGIERHAVRAGRAVGDLVHPLPHAPELARAALVSSVADMTNAAPTSALGVSTAAGFIGAHLGGFGGRWLHVDMEGTARSTGGRGTGFGVGLLLRLAGVL